MLPLLDVTSGNARLLLESKLPCNVESFDFELRFMGSDSRAGKAPMNGIELAKADISFAVFTQATPSLKIVGAERVFNIGDTLTVDVRYVYPSGYTISADVMLKGTDGTYNSTGMRPAITSQGELSVSLAGQGVGSYCLMVIIKNSEGDTVASTPYYFIIYDTSAG